MPPIDSVASRIKTRRPRSEKDDPLDEEAEEPTSLPPLKAPKNKKRRTAQVSGSTSI